MVVVVVVNYNNKLDVCYLDNFLSAPLLVEYETCNNFEMISNPNRSFRAHLNILFLIKVKLIHVDY